jgi:hypothetical protein
VPEEAATLTAGGFALPSVWPKVKGVRVSRKDANITALEFMDLPTSVSKFDPGYPGIVTAI